MQENSFENSDNESSADFESSSESNKIETSDDEIWTDFPSRSETNETEISDDEILTDSTSRNERDETSNSDVLKSKNTNSKVWFLFDINSLHGKIPVESLTNLEEVSLVGFLFRNMYLVEKLLESENDDVILSVRNDSKSLMISKNIYKTYAVLVIKLLTKEDQEAQEYLYNHREQWTDE